jgi:hypothetical protein
VGASAPTSFYMANIHRGEVEIEIEGNVYRLHAGINAIAEAESALSTPDKRVTFQEIFQEASRGSVTHVRVLIWAMLRKHHRMSLDAVGDLIDLVGIGTFNKEFENLLTAMTPDERDLNTLGVDANPTKAQAKPRGGTSTPFERKRVRSA